MLPNTGFLEQPEDKRDFKAEPLLGGVFNWDIGFDVEEEIGRKLPHFNQLQTQSCVACAISIYQSALQGLVASVRDLYSWIFQPNGGAYIRDGLARACDPGQAQEKDVPTAPWTETHLREKATGEPLTIDAEYRFLDGTSIDNFALAIKQWLGVVAGIRSWGHCMYAKAAHLHNGKKCIVFHNSYGASAANFTHNDANGDCHIDESYFIAGDVINPGSLTPKKHPMLPNPVIKPAPTEPEQYLELDNGIELRMENQDVLHTLIAGGQLPGVADPNHVIKKGVLIILNES